MLDITYVDNLSQWISTTLSEITVLIRQVDTPDKANEAKRRIRLFIEELEQKKREINLNIQEIRQQYDREQPTKGFLSRRTRQDIDNDRDRTTLPWKKGLSALDKQIIGMKQLILEIDRQVSEQT